MFEPMLSVATVPKQLPLYHVGTATDAGYSSGEGDIRLLTSSKALATSMSLPKPMPAIFLPGRKRGIESGSTLPVWA